MIKYNISCCSHCNVVQSVLRLYTFSEILKIYIKSVCCDAWPPSTDKQNKTKQTDLEQVRSALAYVPWRTTRVNQALQPSPQSHIAVDMKYNERLHPGFKRLCCEILRDVSRSVKGTWSSVVIIKIFTDMICAWQVPFSWVRRPRLCLFNPRGSAEGIKIKSTWACKICTSGSPQ